jgi:hypothetical protein
MENGSQTGAAENKKCLQLLMDSILLQIVFFSSPPPPPGSIYMQIPHRHCHHRNSLRRCEIETEKSMIDDKGLKLKLRENFKDSRRVFPSKSHV